MPVPTLVLKNTSISESLSVNDLGIYLGPGEEIDLILNFRDEDVLESLDIQAAIAGTGEVTLAGTTVLSYQDLIDFFTKLSRYDKIDFTYISSNDDDTDVTGSELEALTDGSDVTSHTHDSRYYTKIELSSSGTSAVHWDNLTNVPALASVHWKSPVALKSNLPLTGNQLSDARIVQDDGDGRPAQYICIATTGTLEEQWVKIADVDWGDASSIHVNPIGNLTSTNVQDALQELQGDIDTVNGIFPTIGMQYTYTRGSSVNVTGSNVLWNLTDTKEFSINSDAGVTEVFNVTASSAGDVVTINGNLDFNGGSFDLLGTANSVITTTNSNLTLRTITSGTISLNSAGSLTFKDQYLTSSLNLSEPGVTELHVDFTSNSIIGAINELKGNISGVAVTLNDAYDGTTGNGSGRIITATHGAVVINSSTATNAPLQLTNRVNAPSTDLAAGQLSVIDGELYVYDMTRTKWLSMSEKHFIWSDNNVKGRYMKIGDALGTNVGYRVPVNATIVKVAVSGAGTNRDIEIRKNENITSIKTFTLIGGTYLSTNDNLDLVAGDKLQVYVDGAAGSGLTNLVVSIYLKYRK